MNLNREELYDLLWSKSLANVANTCQISKPVLQQICLDHNIPLPFSAMKPEKDRQPLPSGEDFELRAAIATAKNGLHYPGEGDFKLPIRLTDPAPLIMAAQRTTTQDYTLHGMEHMLRAGHGELAIRSSKANMERALRIMDLLVKTWQKRDYRIVNQDKETRIYIRETSLRVGLRETTTIEPAADRFGTQVHKSTGLLALKVDGYFTREWKDGTVPLETHIKEILDHMEVSARALEKVWAERKIRERKNREEQRILANVIKADPEENAAFEALLQEAQRWNELNILDKYLDALRDNVRRSPAFEQWLEWARHRRRLFDPVEKVKSNFF